MTTFLLWNVQRKHLDGYIVRLVQQHDVDVLLLIEHPKPEGMLLGQLARFDSFQRVVSHDRFGVYVRFESAAMKRMRLLGSDGRADCWEIRLGKKSPLLLVVVHGLDIINNSEGKRGLFFARLAAEIRRRESLVGHKNTMVVGDFNANPFETVVGGVNGLHSIRVRQVGGKTTRSVLNQDHEFFCNPMWSCYKGWEKGPPGTHYYNGSDVHEVFWHILDQVVLRPQALHMFSEKNLRVLAEAGNVSLLTEFGLPDASGASDHLPVIFKMNLKRRAGDVEPMA